MSRIPFYQILLLGFLLQIVMLNQISNIPKIMDATNNEQNNFVISELFDYSRYIGGSGDDEATSITVDSSGDIYVTGYTNSIDFPLVEPYSETFGGARDCFVVKLNGKDGSIVYSTFIGGSSSDFGKSIAVDGYGNAYVTGHTLSDDFPMLNSFNDSNSGGYDCFVFKLNADGDELIYSTYVGSYSNDYPESIVLDDAGNVYVTGATFAFVNYTNFPVINAYDNMYNGGEADCFVFKLNAAGDELLYSTIVGGELRDHAYSIAIDSLGNAYVTGDTDSPDFPTVNAYDNTFGPSRIPECFVFKLGPSGNELIYSTFVAGSDSDHGWSIALDDYQNVYVTGETNSHDFPVVKEYDNSFNGGWSDCYVFKLSSSGDELLFSSYIGGSGDDEGASIVLDTPNSIYVVGYTSSIDFPIVGKYDSTLDGPSDIILFQLNTTDGSLLSSSYCGGGRDDWANSLVMDSDGNIHVAGKTNSEDFPIDNTNKDSYAGGKSDCYIFKMRREIIERDELITIMIILTGSGVVVVIILIVYHKRRD